MRRLLVSLFVLLSLSGSLFVGCGAEPEPGGIDAGVLPDGGVGADAGQQQDAGTQSDAGEEPDAGPTVSFAADVQPIFNARCGTACHGTTNPSGGLSLTAASSYGELVNVPGVNSACRDLVRVEPGEPTSSLLYRKITGTACGTRMPQNGAALSAAQIDTIEQWIFEGAQNN